MTPSKNALTARDYLEKLIESTPGITLNYNIVAEGRRRGSGFGAPHVNLKHDFPGTKIVVWFSLTVGTDKFDRGYSIDVEDDQETVSRLDLFMNNGGRYSGKSWLPDLVQEAADALIYTIVNAKATVEEYHESQRARIEMEHEIREAILQGWSKILSDYPGWIRPSKTLGQTPARAFDANVSIDREFYVGRDTAIYTIGLNKVNGFYYKRPLHNVYDTSYIDDTVQVLLIVRKMAQVVEDVQVRLPGPDYTAM